MTCATKMWLINLFKPNLFKSAFNNIFEHPACALVVFLNYPQLFDVMFGAIFLQQSPIYILLITIYYNLFLCWQSSLCAARIEVSIFD